MNFNERLRKLRISRGLTLLQVAQSVGVSEATVQRWESGNIRTLHHDRVALLAEALGTTPSYLMGWDDPDAFTKQSVSDLTDDASVASDPAPAGVYLTDHERMDIGEYIKSLRTQRNMSQAELGKLLGVQRAAVQKWECGKVQNLKRETLKKLSDIFGVPASSFIVEAPARPAPTGVYLTDHERAVVEAYRARPDMQAAVDVLLGVPADAADGVKRA